MKLAQIILPIADNEGRSLFMEHQQLKHDLLEMWGGYTMIDGRGAWRSPDGKVHAEASIIYKVAMERADVVKFRALAASVALYCRQEAVMIVTPGGDVEFVHPPRENNLARAS